MFLLLGRLRVQQAKERCSHGRQVLAETSGLTGLARSGRSSNVQGPGSRSIDRRRWLAPPNMERLPHHPELSRQIGLAQVVAASKKPPNLSDETGLTPSIAPGQFRLSPGGRLRLQGTKRP